MESIGEKKSMQNSVELIGTYGSDEIFAQSAWSSTSREITDEKRERIGSFLEMLAKEGHHTPFEKSLLHFSVTCDAASQIHLLKHRVGVSVNSESARYKELKDDKFYTPDDWPEEIKQNFERRILFMYDDYHWILNTLENKYGFSRSRAKESARFVLPYANQLTLDISFNMRSFIHFQGLRNKPEAQKEICEIANTMLELVKQTGKFDLTLKAFGY